MTRVYVRTFLTTVVLAAASLDAAAQSAVCETVRPGDTASTVARRLTGRADSYDEPWFRPFAIAGDSESPVRQTPIWLARVRSRDAGGSTRVRHHPPRHAGGGTLPPSRIDEREAFECSRGDIQP